MFGSLTSVEARALGSELTTGAAAGATTLAVDFVADFSEAGGQLLLNDSVIAYSTVDPVAETITLAAPLVVAADVDDFVQVFAGGAPAVEWLANVAIDEADTITALIPSGLSSFFAEGTPGTAQSVEIVLRGSVYEVTNRPNTAPSFDGAVVWNPRIAGIASVLSVATATWTQVPTYAFSEADGIDFTGGVLSIVNPGTYLVLARASFLTNGTGRRGVRITQNGVEVAPFLTQADSSGQTYVPTFASVRVIELDAIAIEVYQSSGSALSIGTVTLTAYRVST